MPLHYLLAVLSGIFGLGGTAILLWRVLRRSEQDIIDDSRTVTGVGRATEKYGIPPSAPVLRRNMIEQGDAVAGFLLLAAGFLCQLFSAFLMLKPEWAVPAWLGVTIIAVLVLLAVVGWRRFGDHAVGRAEVLLRRWK